MKIKEFSAAVWEKLAPDIKENPAAKTIFDRWEKELSPARQYYRFEISGAVGEISRKLGVRPINYSRERGKTITAGWGPAKQKEKYRDNQNDWLRALLADMLWAEIKRATKRGGRNEDALDWIFSDSPKYCIPFCDVCYILGYDYRAIREKIMALRGAAPRK